MQQPKADAPCPAPDCCETRSTQPYVIENDMDNILNLLIIYRNFCLKNILLAHEFLFHNEIHFMRTIRICIFGINGYNPIVKFKVREVYN